MKNIVIIGILTFVLFSCTDDLPIPTGKGNLNEITAGIASQNSSSSATFNYSLSNNNGTSILQSGVLLGNTVNLNTSTDFLIFGGTNFGNQSVTVRDLIPGLTYYWKPFSRTTFGYNFSRMSSITTSPIPSTNAQGLVGNICFNNNFNDYSTSNNFLSSSGSFSYLDGKYGGPKSSILFGGSSFLSKSGLSNFSTGSYTMMLWFKPNAVGSTLLNLGSGSNGPQNSTATVRLINNNTLLFLHWANDKTIRFGYDFLDGNWYCLIWTFNFSTKTEEMYVYQKNNFTNAISGQFATFPNSFVDIRAFPSLSIGALRNQFNSSVTEYYRGQFDDFRLFNRVIPTSDFSFWLTL